MTAAIRQTFAEKPAEFDPRKYLGPARDNIGKTVQATKLLTCWVQTINWLNN